MSQETIFMTCCECGNLFKQHFTCTTCGAQKLYDNTLRTANEDNEKLRAYLDTNESELERERMRLAACGVAALGYFTDCHDDYKSASLDDVLQLVHKEADARENLRLLRDSLLKYGGHTDECPLNVGEWNCTCGFVDSVKQCF